MKRRAVDKAAVRKSIAGSTKASALLERRSVRRICAFRTRPVVLSEAAPARLMSLTPGYGDTAGDDEFDALMAVREAPLLRV